MSGALVCVTGAAGFVGSYVVQRLLARGYRVRATVRDPGDAAKNAHLRALGDVALVRADLTEEGSFDAAVAGCDYVVHAASAVTLRAKDPQRDIVDVAVHGTRNVLQACERAGTVKRVVLTSSTAAVVDARSRPGARVDARSWNESATLRDDAYGLSKARAERFARAFVRSMPENKRFGLVSICPSLVLGAVLCEAHLRTSPSVIVELLGGSFPAVPDLLFPVVDVRDVADAHVNALAHPAPRDRYGCSQEQLGMRAMAALLREHVPEARVPRFDMPDAVMYATALVDPRLSLAFVRRNLGICPRFECDETREDLGVPSLPAREAVLATARSIVAGGYLRPRGRRATR